ncbi:MAG: hypothetical protein O3A01_07340 [bacterium]|nr:hypothetical protein [bacterium]
MLHSITTFSQEEVRERIAEGRPQKPAHTFWPLSKTNRMDAVSPEKLQELISISTSNPTEEGDGFICTIKSGNYKGMNFIIYLKESNPTETATAYPNAEQTDPEYLAKMEGENGHRYRCYDKQALFSEEGQLKPEVRSQVSYRRLAIHPAKPGCYHTPVRTETWGADPLAEKLPPKPQLSAEDAHLLYSPALKKAEEFIAQQVAKGTTGQTPQVRTGEFGKGGVSMESIQIVGLKIKNWMSVIIPHHGKALSDAKVMRILVELIDMIYVKEIIASVSLEPGFQKMLDVVLDFPNTLIGKAFIRADYVMKALVCNGEYLPYDTAVSKNHRIDERIQDVVFLFQSASDRCCIPGGEKPHTTAYNTNASRFHSEEDMDRWVRQHWPGQKLERKTDGETSLTHPMARSGRYEIITRLGKAMQSADGHTLWLKPNPNVVYEAYKGETKRSETLQVISSESSEELRTILRELMLNPESNEDFAIIEATAALLPFILTLKNKGLIPDLVPITKKIDKSTITTPRHLPPPNWNINNN